MRILRLLLNKTMIVICAMVSMFAGSALANGLTVGTETLTFTDGSTMTGFFDLNPTTNQLVSWNFLYSGGTSFGAETFNSADTTCGVSCAAAPSSLVVSNFNGDEVLTFEENQPNGTRQEFDIAVACGGVANCLSQAATGMSFAVEGPITFPTPCPGQFCIESGLQAVPEGFGGGLLAPGGFINVTDPPGSLAFNVSNSADGTVFNGTGGTTPAPEPGTLALLGTGLVALVVGQRKK
jgi:hypothetical protein